MQTSLSKSRLDNIYGLLKNLCANITTPVLIHKAKLKNTVRSYFLSQDLVILKLVTHYSFSTNEPEMTTLTIPEGVSELLSVFESKDFLTRIACMYSGQYPYERLKYEKVSMKAGV